MNIVSETVQKDRSDEVALITGSRRGIGLGVAIELAKLGFKIVLNGVTDNQRSNDSVEKIKELGAECFYIQADLSNTADRKRLVQEIKTEYGRLDILINNAGVAPDPREDMLKASEESFDRIININLKGPYFLTQTVANWMIELTKEDPEKRPKIVNITSINAVAATPVRGDYCISKAGLAMMNTLYAVRLAEYGIGVYEIRPGLTKTDMVGQVEEKYTKLIEEGLTPIKRWGFPVDIGKAVAAIAMDLYPYSTGEVINVDGGFHMRRF
jgi:3-oxoacyl-[acyl-carrier protein] reductase